MRLETGHYRVGANKYPIVRTQINVNGLPAQHYFYKESKMVKTRIYYTRDKDETTYALFASKPHLTDGVYCTDRASLLCPTSKTPFDGRLPKLRPGQMIVFEQVKTKRS